MASVRAQSYIVDIDMANAFECTIIREIRIARPRFYGHTKVVFVGSTTLLSECSEWCCKREHGNLSQLRLGG